jgi:hypothetical protein
MSGDAVDTGDQASGAVLYERFPVGRVVLYNSTTIVHFGLASAGLLVAFSRWPVVAWLLGVVYLVFAFAQMYLVMPLKVCTHCAYRTLTHGRCVSGLNLVSGRFSRPRSRDAFAARSEGVVCHNNLYMTALIAPLALILVGLAVDYSVAGTVILLLLAALLAFRYFVLFRRVACPHCVAKRRCPNARAMGIR